MGAEFIVGMTTEPGAQVFVGYAVREVLAQQAFNCLWDQRRRAAIAYSASDRGVLANCSAEAEIVSINQLAFEFDFLAFDADVGNPVLAASVGAAGHIELELLVEARKTLFEFIDDPTEIGRA